MTSEEDKRMAAFDKKHEAEVERGRKRFQKEVGNSILYSVPLSENLPMQVFNKVLKEQARKKVN